MYLYKYFVFILPQVIVLYNTIYFIANNYSVIYYSYL